MGQTNFTVGKIWSGHFWYTNFWVPGPPPLFSYIPAPLPRFRSLGVPLGGGLAGGCPPPPQSQVREPHPQPPAFLRACSAHPLPPPSGASHQRLIKCVGGSPPVCISRRAGSALAWPKSRRVCESGTVAPLLTRAAAAPWRPSHDVHSGVLCVCVCVRDQPQKPALDPPPPPPTAADSPPTAVSSPPTAADSPPTAVGCAPTAADSPPAAVGYTTPAPAVLRMSDKRPLGARPAGLWSLLRARSSHATRRRNPPLYRILRISFEMRFFFPPGVDKTTCECVQSFGTNGECDKPSGPTC